MVVTSSGLNRTADLVASTFPFFSIGTGVTTVNIGDTALESSVSLKYVNIISTSNNVVYHRTIFNKLEGNSASNITEMGLFGTSTAQMCWRSVASTATWTAFSKTSTISASISTSITVST